MFITRSNDRTPANVADSWQRIEAWLASHAPEIAETLRPGCASDEIEAFETQFELTLPEDVKESFLIHDGQELYEAPGPLVGQPLDPLEGVRSSLTFYRQFYEEEQQSDHNSGLGDRATSYPPDAILCEYVTPNWISLGDWDGNCYGVDLNPGPNGVLGQVINFGRDEDDKYVLALTWAHFLEDIADEYEAGNLIVTRSSEGEIGDIGRPGHDDQALFNFYREWSLAKLPAPFQQQQAVPRKPVFEGVVIHNERADQAILLVQQFIATMHEYEMKWLERRPIHELGYRLIIESSSGYSTEGLQNADSCAPVSKLNIHSYTQRGIQEKKAILKKFATPGKRVMEDAFVQRYPLEYDPDRDRATEVREVSPDHLIVYLESVDGVTTRYHVTQSGDRWLVHYKDQTTDHITFEKSGL